MTTVFDVAAYILAEKGELTVMKLQKLVYYSQAWHLAWTDEPLFDNRIEAWKDGPVCPELWQQHAYEFKIASVTGGNPEKLNKRQAKSINKVLKFYGGKSSQWLSDLTHMEDPLMNARRGVASGARSNAEITHRAMLEYYSSI